MLAAMESKQLRWISPWSRRRAKIISGWEKQKQTKKGQTCAVMLIPIKVVDSGEIHEHA